MKKSTNSKARHAMPAFYRTHIQDVIEIRTKTVLDATEQETVRLVEHQLARTVDEIAPEVFRHLNEYKTNGVILGDRTIDAWLRCGGIEDYAAQRVEPAIAGLRKLKQHAVAATFEHEFHEWVRRCRAQAQALPKLPRKYNGCAAVVRRAVTDAEAQVTTLVSMVDRLARQAGFDLPYQHSATAAMLACLLDEPHRTAYPHRRRNGNEQRRTQRPVGTHGYDARQAALYAKYATLASSDECAG
jgi:hypothetical protein